MDKNKKVLLLAVGGFVLVAAVLGFLWLRNRNSSGTDDSGPVEIVYWGLWEPESHMKEVIETYEEENPNVKIKYTQKRITQYEDNIYERLTDPQTTPDIVRINNTWTYKFQSRLSPLPSEIMSSSEYQQSFYTTAIEDFSGSDGNIYAIPWEIDGLGMYYNKDLFTQAGINEPPADWQTLINDAQELTVTDDSGDITQAGAAIGCSNNINHSADIMSALLLQNNVPMTDSAGTTATFDTTRGEDALKFYTDFATTHNTWSCTLRNDLEMFASGKLAIMFGPSWRTFDVINMNPSINFDVAKFPNLPANNEEIYYSMYWGDAVSAQSAHQLEAWRFVKYLSEKEQQKKVYAAASQSRAFGEPYSRPDLASEIENSPYVGAYIKMAPNMMSWRMGDQTTAETALNTAISDVVDGRKNESAALTEAVTAINEKNQELYGSQ